MKRRTDYMIREIIDTYKEILSESKKIGPPKPLTETQKSEGLRVSKQGSSAPLDVKMTPLFSQALKLSGEKKSDEFRLMAKDPETKAEAWINKTEEILLRKYNGPERTDFNEDLPLRSVEHFNVQCWRNRKINKRDIAPNMEQDRLKNVANYYRESSALNLLSLIQTDVVFQKAIKIVMNVLPEVKANNDFKLVSQPFMNKDSNVSYPWFRNDRAVDKETGKTYGELAVELASKTPLEKLHEYNYTTLFGRNQKLKARAIYATSRIVNIVLNQLEAEEIKAYRDKSPLFVGYKDDLGLKEALMSMLKYAESKGYGIRNIDQAKFDLHVNEAFIILIGAMSVVKANGSKSKQIARKRAVLATRTWLVNGLTGKIEKIYGRIFSGYIDTNRMGGLVNALAVLYGIMKQNPDYSTIVYETIYWMMVMGDDNCFVYPKLDYELLQKDLAALGFEINREKDEFGPFFLQYRLFEFEGELVMSYAWTRVWRSMLFKETQKALGPYGWILAWWQQIAKVVEHKPSLYILVNLACMLDEHKLALDKSIDEIIKLVDEEDKAAISKLNTENAKKKFLNTWDKLADGDPQKARFERNNSTYLKDLQDAMKSVYDPSFASKEHLPPLHGKS